MPVITFLFMNTIVITGSFFITYKLFRLFDFTDSLICGFILYFAQIVLTETVLGVLGILTLPNLILFNLLVLFMIWAFLKNRASSFSLGAVKDYISWIGKNKLILLGISLIFGFGLTKLFINLCNPPFGWDSLNYHFTFPVEWLKQANLNNPITISDDPSPTYYPLNGSLFFSWLMFPLRNVFLADLGQMPFFILAFLAVYNISKKVGLTKESSFYAVILFSLIPNFFKELEKAHVDIIIAGLFLAALNYLLLLHKEFSWKNVLVYSITLGLFLGTKTLALPYSILLFLPFIFLALKNINKYHLFIISIAVVLLFGGFAYIRNFFQTGNPFYPLDFKLFGADIFKGVMDMATYRAHFRIEDYALSKLLFHEGLGAQSLIFILPSIFLALPLTLIKRKKLLNFSFFYFLTLPLLIYFSYRFIIPLANTRYLYPLLGTGIIIGLYTAETLSIPKRILKTLVFICILASVFELGSNFELIASIVLSISAFFLLGSLAAKKWFPKRLCISFTIIFFVIALILLERDYVKNEFPRYIRMEKYSGFWPDATRAWNWLNANTTGNNIAYVGRPVPFPLYGSSFKNNVYYVSVNKQEPAKVHNFTDSHYQWGYDFSELHKNLEKKGNYRSGADYFDWLNNLFHRRIDYLFIYSLHQTKDIEFPLEDRWARANPDIFHPAFSNSTIHIYKTFKLK